ncbi:MAG: DJ-1/PfpI family protein [Chromatiales bacterium]|jgi:4-methyl-5(b-hydroxyethyl)-thiazole monophosphate biosynthesis
MASVLVPLAEGCEELEAVTIIDLLRRAGIEVVTAGLEVGPVSCSRGVVLVPDTTLDAVLDREFDMVTLPGGGPGADRLSRDPRIRELLQRHAAAGRYITAICAAPKALAGAGLLEGRRATAYPGVLDAAPGGAELSEQSVEIDGRIVTSRGPGTAMDFALTLIELLLGRERRDAVEGPLQRPAQA